jgi:hypothetical protein
VSQTRQPAGRPGRYDRSFSGLIGAMVVLVLVVGAFVVWRGLFRDNDFEPVEPLDYAETVSIAQESGFDPVYPSSLPDGWEATSVDLDPTSSRQNTVWALGVLTDERRFVGVSQGDQLDDMVELWFADDVEETGTETLDSELADEWTRYADSEGEVGYAAEVGGEDVLVHGSAPEDQVVGFLGLLTQDRLPRQRG